MAYVCSISAGIFPAIKPKFPPLLQHVSHQTNNWRKIQVLRDVAPCKWVSSSHLVEGLIAFNFRVILDCLTLKVKVQWSFRMSELLTQNTVSHPRRHESSATSRWKPHIPQIIDTLAILCVVEYTYWLFTFAVTFHLGFRTAGIFIYWSLW